MRLPRSLISVVAVALGAATIPAQNVFTVSPFDDVLRVVDSNSAATLSTVPLMTIPPSTILGANGLSRHPSTGTVYVIVKILGTSGRLLGTLDTATGVVTVIGNTGENVAGIAFDASGTLYAVTGDGSATPETLFRVSTTTGALTLLTALGNGSDGETIGFNPDDGLLYHASGLGTPNVDEIFETIDPGSLMVTNVALSGFDYGEMLSMSHRTVAGDFSFSDVGGRLGRITPGGVATLVGVLDHTAKGIVPEFSVPPAYPGTTEDFVMQVRLSSGTQSPDGVHPVSPGDGVLITTFSSGSTFDGAPLFVVGEVFVTGSPPLGAIPGLALSGNPATSSLVFGGPVPPTGQFLTVPPLPGFSFSLAYPGGLSGFSVLVQSIASSGAAANNIYATTDGNEMQFN